MPLLLGLGLLSTKLSQVWKQRLLRLGGLLVAAMGGYILWQAITLLRLQGL
jgi:sulfite exporter TauE/SafE